MRTKTYVPLRVFGQHALLRGVVAPEDWARAAARLGLPALALTDRNAVMGGVRFVREARRVGIHPLLGSDLVWGLQHLTVLARDAAGYAALCELVSLVHLRPPGDLVREVARRSARLVVLCSDPELLPRVAASFPSDTAFAGVARLPGRPAGRVLQRARVLGLRAVALGDVHFTDPDQLSVHRVLRAAARGTVIDRLGPRDGVAPREAVLATPREMARRHAGEEELLAATHEVAALCEDFLELDRPRLPHYHLPDGRDPAAWLAELARAGARERYGDPLPPAVAARLENELGVIADLDFPGYFLFVREIVAFARARGIPFVGRGSAADSLVVHCLGFTRVCPLEHGLVFERFLSRSRPNLPDIDLDFCWRRRDEVIAHVYARHGEDKVATISTHVAFRLRSAFREVAKAMALPPAALEAGSRVLPHAFEGSLAAALDAFPECRGLERREEIAPALALAEKLRGLPRHLGMHPGGMVIADRPLATYSPVVRSAKGPLITQHEMRGIEALGLVKMDLLGQRSLSTLHDTIELLRTEGADPPDLARLAPDDPRVRRLLGQGRTLGCFQVESPGMRKLLVSMRARERRDVIDAIALIRPGPAASGMKDAFVRRRRGEEPVRYDHPALEPVLRETAGIMLYQEDILRVTATLTGWSLAEGDLVRSALGKKKDPERLARLREDFLERTAAEGLPEELARAIWERVGDFAAFSFCKAHAATYGQLAYEELWLKAHHPAAFFCAVLNNARGYYPDRVYLEEARRHGVRFLLPDVNRSRRGFRFERGALRIGLERVKGLSEKTLERLMETRAREGAILSLGDLLERVRPDRREARRLVQCGALDAFEIPRPELLWRLELAARRPLEETTENLFGPVAPAPPVALPRLPDYPESRKRREEYELLGLTAAGAASVHGSAPENSEALLARELPEHAGRTVTAYGWCSATRRARTRSGRYMRFLTLEDATGTVECVLFPEAYQRCGDVLDGEGPYLARGAVHLEEDVATLHVEGLERVPLEPPTRA